ncbi:hypothetical protein ABID97_005753 [Variovorax sp. OAS795]
MKCTASSPAIQLPGKIDPDAGKILGIFQSQVQDQGKV